MKQSFYYVKKEILVFYTKTSKRVLTKDALGDNIVKLSQNGGLKIPDFKKFKKLVKSC